MKMIKDHKGLGCRIVLLLAKPETHLVQVTITYGNQWLKIGKV